MTKTIINTIKRILPDKTKDFIQYKVMPPKAFIKYKYKKVYGRELDFNNPDTFNAKLQWRKFNDKNPLYTLCSDKYEVREYISNKIGSKYLIPLQYVTEEPYNIDFNKLKTPYIIKSTHGTAQLIIIRDKNDIKEEEIKKRCKKWLNDKFYYETKEYHYKNITPQIIIENLLLDKNKIIPNDYKFHCFKGKVEFIQLDEGRFGNRTQYFTDNNWNKVLFRLTSKKDDKFNFKIKKSKKPNNLKKMIRIAEKLSKDFKYVRVDLYNLDGKIYFGELTFTPGAGFLSFYPDKYDFIYGKKFDIN